MMVDIAFFMAVVNAGKILVLFLAGSPDFNQVILVEESRAKIIIRKKYVL